MTSSNAFVDEAAKPADHLGGAPAFNRTPLRRSAEVWPASASRNVDSKTLRVPAEAAIWLLLLLLGFGFQGTRSLYEADEGRYTNIALQMLDSGDWRVPHQNADMPHLAKPPLTYWALAASFKIFGRNEWAARLPNALAFVFTGWLVLSIAASMGLRPPWLASAIWATSAGPALAADIVTTDTLLACFETAAMAAFLRAQCAAHRKPVHGWLIASWSSFGLAFLTKGPPALLPLAVLMIWRIWQRRELTRRPFLDPLGIALFLMLSLGWFVTLAIGHRELIEYFLKYEFMDRIFSDTHHRNAGWTNILKIYLPSMIGGMLPWAVPAMLRRRGAAAAIDMPLLRLLWLWVLLPLAVFCIARSRMPLYVLPLFVPMALLLTPRLVPWWRERRRLMLLIAAVWTLLLLACKALFEQLPSHDNDRQLSHQVAQAMKKMKRPADEVVFVSGKPLYGLRFYLNLPVERIALLPGERSAGDLDLYALQTICEEMREDEHPLWVVRAADVSEFSSQAQGCGATVKALHEDVAGRQTFELLLPALRAPSPSR